MIIGVTGQDGAYLAKLLLSKGYFVLGITRSIFYSNTFNLNYLNVLTEIKLIECNILDFSSIFNLIKEYKPDEIYNLAAQSSVGVSFNQPVGSIHYNILSVLNVLEVIRILKVKTKFYQASSSEMFGKVEKLPITHETSMHPLSPYAVSKVAAHWTVVNYREAYKIFCCSGILFNHESYLRSNSFFIKKIISESVKNKNKKDWNLVLGNLNVKRDFGYAPKYVEAMWLMLQQKVPSDFVICSGKSYSLYEIVLYVLKKVGIDRSKLVIDEKLFRPIDIDDIYGDNSRAKELLNWDYGYDFFDILDILIEEEINNNKNKYAD